MRIYPVVCFALVTIVLTRAQLGLAGRSGPPGMREPAGRIGIPQMKYCTVSSKITTFLKQFRFIGQKGATGEKGPKGSGGLGSRGKTQWAYDCLHAGLNFQDNVFEIPTYQCCLKCEWPNFSQCVRKVAGSGAQSRCNSEALRCIARCINTKGGKPGRPGPPGRGRPGPPGRPGPQKCLTTRKRDGNSYCLERSCILV